MRKSKRTGGGRHGASHSAVGVLRPAVEAAMLAAVALGCAQGGWALVAPGAADALSSDEGNLETEIVVAEIRSPFSPDATFVEGASNAAMAYLSTVRVVGVRMAGDPARSGAIIALQDGSQRAFLVGQELSAGIRLDEVRADGLVLSYEGGSKGLALASAPTFSYANALMGRTAAPAEAATQLTVASSSLTPQTLLPVSDGSSPFFAPAAPSQKLTVASAEPQGVAALLALQPDIGAWFANVAAQAQVGAEGVRIDGPLPAAVANVGLRNGDVITAVNGVAIADRQGVLAAASTGAVELTVQRSGGSTVVLRASLRSPA